MQQLLNNLEKVNSVVGGQSLMEDVEYDVGMDFVAWRSKEKFYQEIVEWIMEREKVDQF